MTDLASSEVAGSEEVTESTNSKSARASFRDEAYGRQIDIDDNLL